jgi:hypothetical protein
MDRAALKVLAGKLGIDPAGKSRDDLVSALQAKRDKGAKGKTSEAAADADDEDDEPVTKKSKKPAVDEDDEDDEPKAKSKKAAAVEADDEEPEPPGEDDYPKVKVMKSDLEAFFRLNKQLLKDAGFFGGKPKKGVEKAPNTYDEIMGDTDLIKSAWADNVWPEIQSGNWKKMKAEADALEDDDE